MSTVTISTRTPAKRDMRVGGEWCAFGHEYQAINPTPTGALV